MGFIESVTITFYSHRYWNVCLNYKPDHIYGSIAAQKVFLHPQISVLSQKIYQHTCSYLHTNMQSSISCIGCAAVGHKCVKVETREIYHISACSPFQNCKTKPTNQKANKDFPWHINYSYPFAWQCCLWMPGCSLCSMLMNACNMGIREGGVVLLEKGPALIWMTHL